MATEISNFVPKEVSFPTTHPLPVVSEDPSTNPIQNRHKPSGTTELQWVDQANPKNYKAPICKIYPLFLHCIASDPNNEFDI